MDSKSKSQYQRFRIKDSLRGKKKKREKSIKDSRSEI